MRYSEGRLEVIDQTVLPHEERWMELGSAADAVDAIRRLAVRGAPLIGIVAAWALALEIAREPGALEAAAAELRAARPTAVNLAWAVDRVAAAARGGGAEAGSPRRRLSRPRRRPPTSRSASTAPTRSPARSASSPTATRACSPA